MIKLFRFLQPFTLSGAGVLLFLFARSMAELYLPTLMANLVDIGIVQHDLDYIWQVGGFMLLVALGSGVAAIVAAFLSAKTATGFSKNLRSHIFAHVSSFSLHEFDKLGTTTLITRTTNDIAQVEQVLLVIMRVMVTAPIMAVGGIIMAFSVDPVLTLVIVVAVPVFAFTIALIAFKGMPLFQAMQLKLDGLNLVLRETLIGVRVIRAFNRTDYAQSRFNDANAQLSAIALRVNRTMSFLMPILMLGMNLTMIAIIWFGGIRIDQGGMQVGALMAFIQYIVQITISLLMVSLLFVMVPRGQVSAARINEILDLLPRIKEPAQARQPPAARGCIEFRDVTFSYPGAEQPAISRISFTAQPGEVVAIIGGTGTGKSTLINLIPRFYDVDSGSVLIDGVDVRELSQHSLRARIGFVPQQAALFTGSIEDNIRYGNTNATDEEIRRVAEIAQALEFISRMPDGFDSAISQGGTNLSGGQKQRLSIARALVRRPEIYIFDDSFSALDFTTDAKLRRALRQETAAATMIIVGQRVTTIMDADRIIVLEDGEIAGIGSHKQLLQSCQVYREIVASQLSEKELTS